MIHGIGTDLAEIARFGVLFQRHGERALEKLLAPAERATCRTSPDPARFLAKRFAAKEALGKALGTGVRAPLLLPAVAIGHDTLGKPIFDFNEQLAALFQERGLISHLSLSDEGGYALAFVILEQR